MSVGQAAEARELLEESYRWCHAGASSLPHALPLAATPPWIVQELSWGDEACANAMQPHEATARVQSLAGI